MAALGIAFVATACGLLPRDPFSLRWAPDGKVCSRAYVECLEQVSGRWAREWEAAGRPDTLGIFSRRLENAECRDQSRPPSQELELFASPGGEVSWSTLTNYAGLQAELHDVDGSWYEVELENGKRGWVEIELLCARYAE